MLLTSDYADALTRCCDGTSREQDLLAGTSKERRAFQTVSNLAVLSPFNLAVL